MYKGVFESFAVHHQILQMQNYGRQQETMVVWPYPHYIIEIAHKPVWANENYTFKCLKLLTPKYCDRTIVVLSTTFKKPCTCLLGSTHPSAPFERHISMGIYPICSKYWEGICWLNVTQLLLVNTKERLCHNPSKVWIRVWQSSNKEPGKLWLLYKQRRGIPPFCSGLG